MSIFGKLFRSSSASSFSASGALPLLCPHCGQKYMIGEDSIVVTKDAVSEGLVDMGATVLGPAEGLIRGPDLVMYGGDLAKDVRQKNLSRVAQIKLDMENCIDRSWRCSKCQGDSIPIPYPSWITGRCFEECDHVNMVPGKIVVTTGYYKCNVCMEGGMYDLSLATQIRELKIQVARGFTGDHEFVRDVRKWALDNMVPTLRKVKGDESAEAMQKILLGHEVVKYFQNGQKFPQCPNCAGATGWTLLRLVDDKVQKYREFVRAIKI